MSKKTHEALCEAAQEAINAVHGDTSVSPEETLLSLRTLADHIDLLIGLVELDLESEQ